MTEDEYYERLALTEFGRAFVRACRPPGYVDPPIRWTTVEQVEEQIRQAAAARRERSGSGPAAPDQ